MKTMINRDNAKIVVFHDSFCQAGGAEKVAEELHKCFPGAAMESTILVEKSLSPYLRSLSIKTTWMQMLPWKTKLYRAFFLLYPLAVDGVDLKKYDLIVSSCFGYAKGAKRGPNAVHICYSHTPMRWVWRTNDYLAREKNSALKQFVLALPLALLKQWELRAAKRPDYYLANSQVVADRLKDAFGVTATVIPPPIDTKRFAPEPGKEDVPPEDFYIVLSRLVPYKRFDLAIQACVDLGRNLVVIGGGPDRERLEAIAAGHPNIKFLGRAPDEVVVDHARRCKALLFPGEEDFGITPLEINAAGRPVVAFRGGGATETVKWGLNGVFFSDDTPTSMARGILQLESMEWDAAKIRAHAASFDDSVFQARIKAFVDEALAKKG